MEKHSSTKKIIELEFRIIEKVKKLRINQGISKMKLSKAIRAPDSFVGKVESYTHPDKYNFKHLHRIALKLKLKSIKDLMPIKNPEFEEIEIVYQMVPKTNKDGSVSKQLEVKVIEIKPVEEK